MLSRRCATRRSINSSIVPTLRSGTSGRIANTAAFTAGNTS